MWNNNGLYGLLRLIKSGTPFLVILIVLILTFIAVYFHSKKLYLGLLAALFFAAIFYFSSAPKAIYAQRNLVVYSNGAYMNLAENTDQKVEYTLYSKKGKVIAQGLYTDDSYPLQTNGYNYFIDFFILFVLLSIVYLYLFWAEDYAWLRDLKRNTLLTPFTYKTAKEKAALLGEKQFCTTCQPKQELRITEEIYKKGMHLLHLECPKCAKTYSERIAL